MINPKFIAIVNYVAIGFLLLALFDMLYGYYTFLKIAIFIISLANAYIYNESKNIFFIIVFFIIAILYNPIIRIGLYRDEWELINIATAIPLFFSARKQIQEYKKMFDNE
jgi:hypothetical protein